MRHIKGANKYTTGLINVDGSNEHANIYIRKDIDNSKEVLIHELTHLLMHDLDAYLFSVYPKVSKDNYFEELEEQFINRMSRSIINIMETK